MYIVEHINVLYHSKVSIKSVGKCGIKPGGQPQFVYSNRAQVFSLFLVEELALKLFTVYAALAK